MSANKLKLGIFGPNCSSGIAATKVAERWSGSWPENLKLARMLDEAGVEFILPIGRWKGWGGETDFENSTFETITWAAGLLAATTDITVFGTVHAPLLHPVFAAKQFVTVDHMSGGRFGLNVVCGWNQDEFDMFGSDQREHDDRYAYGAEWLDVIQGLWSADGPRDFLGDYFDLKRLQANPKPFGGTRPLVMNAGSSAAGKAFALNRADCLFTTLRSIDQGARTVAELQAEAEALGRDIDIFHSAHIVCRPTNREANEYYRWFADENADWAAVEHMFDIGQRHGATAHKDGPSDETRMRFAAGYGSYPLVGDPDTVVAEMERISAAGFSGFAAGLVNYLDEFPYVQSEVLPRLERLGLRTPRRSSS